MKRILMAAAAAVALPAGAMAAGPQVTLPQGTVEGITQYSIDSFKGIPYAAPHASELPFVFAKVGQRYGEAATADDHAEARLIHAYWVNFAKTGNPNGSGLPEWPVYTPDGDIILTLTPDASALAGPDPWKARLNVTAAKADGG